jgi:hypothetical protein
VREVDTEVDLVVDTVEASEAMCSRAAMVDEEVAAVEDTTVEGATSEGA